jgi:hypothetical protein
MADALVQNKCRQSALKLGPESDKEFVAVHPGRAAGRFRKLTDAAIVSSLQASPARPNKATAWPGAPGGKWRSGRQSGWGDRWSGGECRCRLNK